jgi:hypothetical protein
MQGLAGLLWNFISNVICLSRKASISHHLFDLVEDLRDSLGVRTDAFNIVHLDKRLHQLVFEDFYGFTVWLL